MGNFLCQLLPGSSASRQESSESSSSEKRKKKTKKDKKDKKGMRCEAAIFGRSVDERNIFLSHCWMLIVISLNRQIAQKTDEWMDSVKSDVLLESFGYSTFDFAFERVSGRKKRKKSLSKEVQKQLEQARSAFHLLFPAKKDTVVLLRSVLT